jgi:opacity protein-like surface antigen
LALLQLRPRFSSLIVTCTLILLGSRFAITQTANVKLPQKKFIPGVDFSLGVFGQLTPTRIPVTTNQFSFGVSTAQTTQGTSPSVGILGTFHQSFKPWLSYNVNLGYTRFSENYSQGSSFVPAPSATFEPFSSFSQGTIGTNMYELTIAYVFEGPNSKRFSTFGQFGGGGLFFLPIQDNSPANQQTRPAMVFGVGANYKLMNHLDIRAEYRGLFYKSPDFAYSHSGFPISKLFTVTNTPTVSLVYRFGRAKKSLSPGRSH